jgi:hypothetical protein
MKNCIAISWQYTIFSSQLWRLIEIFRRTYYTNHENCIAILWQYALFPSQLRRPIQILWRTFYTNHKNCIAISSQYTMCSSLLIRPLRKLIRHKLFPYFAYIVECAMISLYCCTCDDSSTLSHLRWSPLCVALSTISLLIRYGDGISSFVTIVTTSLLSSLLRR